MLTWLWQTVALVWAAQLALVALLGTAVLARHLVERVVRRRRPRGVPAG